MFLVTPILSLQLISLNNSKATVGIRYQIEPDEDYNEIILHIRFKETDARLQQETLGILESI
jgi:hypothetical protein